MGSGMYPAGAYVTYEHEYILIFRKGGKRNFNEKEKKLRQESAYFWEERNVWFSDLWEIKGVSQKIKTSNKTRTRNASYPFEIPYRLVNMYSIKGDTVLDPFCGLGTTTLACIASERNSIGIEIDKEIKKIAEETILERYDKLNEIIDKRLSSHLTFIDKLPKEEKEKCYKNNPHNFLVKTKQETNLNIKKIKSIKFNEKEFLCEYK